MYGSQVKSFMHAKTIPNSVTVATGKIKHTGKSSFLPEFEYLKTLVPESEWKNIKVSSVVVWYHPSILIQYFASSLR